MSVKDYSKDNFNESVGGKVRSQYIIKNWDEKLNQAYSKYWIKLQDNLVLLMPSGVNRWRYLMEWRESGQTGIGDYRWNFQIRTPNDSSLPLYWAFSAEKILSKGKFRVDWRENSTAAKVPIGEWFKLEVFWKQAPDSTGRIWIAVNDTVIIDRYGSNMLDSPIENWHFFKVYVSDECMDFGHNYQWIDDVEIWNDFPITTNIEEENQLPLKFKLYQNYPNPFNPSTVIQYEIPVGTDVSLKVYDVLGNEVVEIFNKYQLVGIYKINFNAENLASGIYIYKLKADKFSQYRKMIFLK